MARTRSAFLGAMGIAFQIFKAIADAVLAEGGSDDDLRKIIQPSGLARSIALVIIGKATIVESPQAPASLSPVHAG